MDVFTAAVIGKVTRTAVEPTRSKASVIPIPAHVQRWRLPGVSDAPPAVCWTNHRPSRSWTFRSRKVRGV